MSLTIDRGMVLQAVMDGQIGAEHVTIDELVAAHHLMADAEIEQHMINLVDRNDVTVFDLEWDYLNPN